MFLTDEEVREGLASRDPEKVATSLESRALSLEALDAVDVPLPGPEVLDAFGDVVPDDVADRFVQVVRAFPDVDAGCTPADVARVLSIAAATHGPTSLALEASLAAKGAGDPAAVATASLAAVEEAGTASADHLAALLSYLLAGDAAVRSATVEALARWREDAGLGPAVEAVLAELDDDERDAVAK